MIMSMTGFRSIPLFLLLLPLFFLSSLLIPLAAPQSIQQRLERDALYELKANLNSSFLNLNWTGPQCPSNDFPHKWSGIDCLNGRVAGIHLPTMGLSGPFIPRYSFRAFTELTELVLANNSLVGRIMDFSSNRKLQLIDLSVNNLHGPIPISMIRLASLQTLLLHDNVLTGTIPPFNQSGLKSLNVSNNNIAGEIPATERIRSFGPDSFANNPALCGPQTLRVCDSSKENTGGEKVEGPAAAADGGGSHMDSTKISSFLVMFLMFDLAGLIAVSLLFVLYCKKARKLEKMDQTPNSTDYGSSGSGDDDPVVASDVEGDGGRKIETTTTAAAAAAAEEEEGKGCRYRKAAERSGFEKAAGKLVFLQGSETATFELQELLKASAEGLGKGSFGNTYKATMEGNKMAVVAKRLRDLRPLTVEELTNHLRFVGGLRHPNLLTPLAYYVSSDEKLLVSKFVQNGNLFNRIHGGRGTKDRVPFRWSGRLTVAQGVARGLSHLHHRSTTAKQTTGSIGIPHGNLKSTNVLLDENESPLVADYGLIPLIAVPIAANRMVCYRSPEYLNHKKVSRKTDVWSYGCLLLELLTGRVSTYTAEIGNGGAVGEGGGVDLCNWVNRAVREEWTCEVLDVEIGAQRSGVPGMLKLLQLAMRCCEKSPEKRPEMAEVVREVEGVRVVMESEDEEELSMDQSLEDESFSVSSISASAELHV